MDTKTARMFDLQQERFGVTDDGQEVSRFTLQGPRGLTVRLIDFGATVTELLVPDRNGKLEDVVLGFDDLAAYESKSPYFGCTVGRVAFRIPHAQFELDGKRFQLTRNNGEHHLHGGAKGFSWKVWRAEPMRSDDGPAVRFSLTSPDGEEGYPGTVDASVAYALTRSGDLRIEYMAVASEPTPVNMTHHSYFNLAGAGIRDVLQHELQIEADTYSETDANVIPTGNLLPVADTAFDFTRPMTIGQRVGDECGQVVGYDLAYALQDAAGSLRRVASLRDPQSGRRMDVLADAPALIFYTGDYLDGSLQGKQGRFYPKYSGLCLETGNLPDAVHHANFPNVILRPGHTYRHTCIYRFAWT
jgi:aldose 1-epimerase